jgi:hypothetical protein
MTFLLEMPTPDFSLRREIWVTLQPPVVQLASDVDLDELAVKWVLPGEDDTMTIIIIIIIMASRFVGRSW